MATQGDTKYIIERQHRVRKTIILFEVRHKAATTVVDLAVTAPLASKTLGRYGEQCTPISEEIRNHCSGVSKVQAKDRIQCNLIHEESERNERTALVDELETIVRRILEEESLPTGGDQSALGMKEEVMRNLKLRLHQAKEEIVTRLTVGIAQGERPVLPADPVAALKLHQAKEKIATRLTVGIAQGELPVPPADPVAAVSSLEVGPSLPCSGRIPFHNWLLFFESGGRLKGQILSVKVRIMKVPKKFRSEVEGGPGVATLFSGDPGVATPKRQHNNVNDSNKCTDMVGEGEHISFVKRLNQCRLSIIFICMNVMRSTGHDITMRLRTALERSSQRTRDNHVTATRQQGSRTEVKLSPLGSRRTLRTGRKN
ncbi:Hypothetical protein, putative [Bodo saltans]|uniref:Uncharacterized protein n=1 Tax=Bodo saltans TaxID=75058 RepID=A0A0S4JQY6_BODSA|nr:Hypothetical protein, putative [Bodo saltans]|eukprot:CUG92959.1 Hypothetical protein, putative [Bodo saltans]